MFGLASEWRFEKGDRKTYSGSSESEYKNKSNKQIIDFAVPGDSRIEKKEKDKIEKYQDLGRELQKIWNVKVKIVPLFVGSLGAIPKEFGNRLKQIGITSGTAQV